MSIVDGTGLIEWEGMLFEPGSDLLARTRWVFSYVRERGATIVGNEAGRPFGVYSDRNVRRASDTASGLSTVNFQWGRYLRGETPSAADPAGGIYASDHTKGLATDTNCSDIAIRREGMRLVGMVQTIPSESWHFAIRSAPLVDLTGWADLGSTPFEKDEDMAFTEDSANSLAQVAEKVTDVIPPMITQLGIDIKAGLDKLGRESNVDFFMLTINDGEGRYGTKGAIIYALTGKDYWLEIRTPDAANRLAEKYGNAANITYDEWNAAKFAATGVK